MPEITDAIFDALERAWSEKDIDGLVALFTPDCVYEDMALGAGGSTKWRP